MNTRPGISAPRTWNVADSNGTHRARVPLRGGEVAPLERLRGVLLRVALLAQPCAVEEHSAELRLG